MNHIHCKEGGGGAIRCVFTGEDKVEKWVDIYMRHYSLRVMSEKRGFVKQGCSLQTWILKRFAVGVTNTAPHSFDLGQMLTCWRME